MHGHGHRRHGFTPHAPRFYDLVAATFSLGRGRRLRERILDAAGLTEGERVLDVACGTGTLALAAKERVGARGTVDGIDASPEMLGRARDKAARAGLAVTFRDAPAQSMPLADATFDVAFCTLAMHHLDPDVRSAALREMGRVLRPEGRALIVEFATRRGLRALLQPVTLLHSAMRRRVLEDVVDRMERSGFGPAVVGDLGLGLGYALARRA
jgi:ubiquinone/menaquinone biosynthesis C-methylase UbiE